MAASERLGEPLAARIAAGGYPAALARPTQRRRAHWHQDHAAALIERDVRDFARIGALEALPRLLRLAAAQTAGLFNVNHLASPFQLTRPTIRSYLTLLERIFLLERLPAWRPNRVSRLIKTPKLHFGDTGLACALLGANTAGLTGDRSLLGQLLETFVFQELRRQADWGDVPSTFFHFRDRDGVEVDLVIERAAGVVTGVEVEASSTVRGRDFRGLRKLATAAGDRFAGGVVLFDGETSARFGDRLYAVPIRRLWEPPAGSRRQQPVDKVTRRSAGDASRLNRPPTGRTGTSLRSSLRFGRNTPGIPPSRALSAGRLTPLGAHAKPPALSSADLGKFYGLVWRFDLEDEAAEATESFLGRGGLVSPDRTVPKLLEALRSEQPARAAESPAFAALWRRGAGFLLSRSPAPPTPPADWKLPTGSLRCDCARCADLRAFCAHPGATVHRVRAVQGDRDHLTGEIDVAGLDLRHETEKRSRPYTLVIFKTRATHERRLREYGKDVAAMRQLLAVADAAADSEPQAAELAAAVTAAG